MSVQVLVADRREGFRSQIVIKLKLIPQIKVTHVRDGLEAFRKARISEFEAIVLTDVLPKVAMPQVVAALRELNMNQGTPILILSGQPEAWVGLKNKFSMLFIFHWVNDIEAMAEWFHQAFFVSGAQGARMSPAILNLDVKIVNDLVKSTKTGMELFAGIFEILPQAMENFDKDYRYLDNIEVACVTSVMSSLFVGTFMVAFSKDTFFKLIGAAGGESFLEFSPKALELGADLMRVIFGQVRNSLVDEMDVDFMKCRPYILRDQEQVRAYHGPNSFVVPFASEVGSIYLIVNFEDIRAKLPSTKAS